jgi:hypothetical protein
MPHRKGCAANKTAACNDLTRNEHEVEQFAQPIHDLISSGLLG